ncbi:RNA polymerase sigma-70 factor, ECF subfamily [Pedobacter steynii]|uniref:RNA polymerase sigma factor n=1 Tax=Pedobacter steynii TaxID=430522 RepID=A0A1H0GIK3_9SPHI|nr:sigma-70 family RNA polymerase sigma factor [Pedobacter steynii]NQX42433.1 sigma-70 family RNA polymerase sigma factor [Pedobacter steynii]SDO06767.1 RNA polymerase sigma-70 factor, ECF subfamily [Pedobacter steynii]
MEPSTHTSGRAKMIRSWVVLYFDSLYSWAFYKTSSKESAEDLVQDTFLVALKSIDQFEGKSDPKSWLFGILRHKVMDYHRQKYKNPGIVALAAIEGRTEALFGTLFNTHEEWNATESPQPWQEEPAHLLDNPDFNEALQDCLKKLPLNWFSAIQLKFLEEKKPDQVCQELGVTPTNYWQIIHRAKLQLRKCIQINWFNG